MDLAGKAVLGMIERPELRGTDVHNRGDGRRPRRNESSSSNLWIHLKNVQPNKGLECQLECFVQDIHTTVSALDHRAEG